MTLHKTAMEIQVRGIATLELPLGWQEDLSLLKEKRQWEFVWSLLVKLGGLVLTSFLISFGATFWNDILAALLRFKTTLKPNP